MTPSFNGNESSNPELINQGRTVNLPEGKPWLTHLTITLW